MTRRGFTLMEVMITVAVIAILASIAVPSYQRTVEQRYWQSAQDILQTIYTGEQVYKSSNNAYLTQTTSTSGSSTAEWNKIYMDNPNAGSSIPVTFSVSVTGGASPTFIATATRTGTPSESMTIDQAKLLCTDGCGGANWPEP